MRTLTKAVLIGALLGFAAVSVAKALMRGGPPVVVEPGRMWVYDAKLEIK